MSKHKKKIIRRTKLRRDNVKKYLEKGSKMLKNKKYEAALKNLSQAIDLDSKCVEAFFHRGLTYQNLEDHKSALGDFNAAIRLNPSDSHIYVHRAISYYGLGKYDESLMDLDKAMKLNPKGRAGFLHNKGNVYMTMGQGEKALEAFSAAIRLKPEMADSYFSRGGVYLSLGNYDKAMADLDKAVELAPEKADYYAGRGVTYGRLNQYEKAIADFNKALELQPNDEISLINKCVAYRNLQQYDKALETIQKTMKLNPLSTKAYFQRGLLHEGLRLFDRALEDYQKVVSIDPNDAHTYVHMGIIYGNLFQFDRAFGFLNKAIEIDPKEYWAYVNRGIGNLDLGKYDIALSDFDTAIKLEPTSAFAHFEKGKALCYLADGKGTFKERRIHRRRITDSFRQALENADDALLRKLAKWWMNFSKIYCDTSTENRKRLRIFAELYEDGLDSDFFSRVLTEKNRFSKFMMAAKTLDKSECCFDVLRRWNSFTPIIPGKAGSNLGGGYFLAWDGYGSIIDPGYDYTENFMKSGRRLGDVRNIIITHAHDDHTADFEALLSLFSKIERHDRLNLFMNLGSQVKFAHLISKNESGIGNVEILNDNETYRISENVDMVACKAIHNDILTQGTSKGLVFQLRKGSRIFNLGITGDTKLYSETSVEEERSLFNLFEDMDVLVLHLGSIHECEFELTADNFENHRYKGEHLGIRGIVNLIFRCRPKLAIVSEFGEELRDLRANIANWIDNTFDNYDSSGNVRVIPGDIGLKIVFDNSVKVKCEICGKLIELEDVEYSDILINHKIAYHCGSHKREEVVERFREQEEKELRTRARIAGCRLDLMTPPMTEISK